MQDWSEGLILNYRLGRKTQYPTQCLMKVLSVEPSAAKRMIGSKVGWPVDDPTIYGKIIGVHGRTGTLRARAHLTLRFILNSFKQHARGEIYH